MPGGRPTDYTPELLAKAEEYLSTHQELGDVVPQIAGLAVHIGVSRETVYAWERDTEKPEFSDIVERVRANQERGLVNGGLRGDLNASITKLALVKHGYQDSQKTEHAGNLGITDMTEQQLDNKLKALMSKHASPDTP
jgi:hypothetical protein